MTTQTYICRGAYPRWTKEEDDRLLSICSGRQIARVAGWEKVAEEFPGRSAVAVRQRYLELRNRAAGIVRTRVRSSQAEVTLLRPPVKRDHPVPAPLPPVEYTTLTAAFFRDPPPGRSALDKMRAGITDDDLPHDYRTHAEARMANRPKITLATEPMR